MPQLTLAATPTTGQDEVLSTLLYISAGPETRNGASLKEITLNLQRNGHYGQHTSRLATLEAEVTTVLSALIGLSHVETTTHARGHGQYSSTGYRLTAAGLLSARRARPQALWS